MTRIAFATIAGVAGFLLYIGAVVALADVVVPLHWTLQLLYYTVAGILWAWPAKWLMAWAARRGPAR